VHSGKQTRTSHIPKIIPSEYNSSLNKYQEKPIETVIIPSFRIPVEPLELQIGLLAQDLTPALGRRSTQRKMSLRRSQTVGANQATLGLKGSADEEDNSDYQSASVCSPSKSRNFDKRPAGMWCIVKKAFDYYDYDKGGDLDHEEFDDMVYDLCNALSTTYSTKKTKEIIRQIDKNGDCSIQFNELLNNLETLWVVLRRKYKTSDAETLQLSKRKPKDVKHNKEMFEYFNKIMKDNDEV
jgi:hypothetical protein